MKRFPILGLIVVLAVGLAGGALAFTAPHASAAIDLSARGPSVGVDRDNNQFVFWKGSTNTNLYEAVWTAATGSWSSGAINLGDVGNNLASAPSVAVATVGEGFLSGDTRYGAQFVFWRGSTDDLWYAFWAGQWYGAFEVPGPSNVASTPSAAFNNIFDEWGSGGSEVTVFWQGTDGLLYFIRLTNPLGGLFGLSGTPQWVGPHEATYSGASLGTLGSPPAASNTSEVGFNLSGAVVDGHGIVTWHGSTNNSLWYVPYTIGESGDLTIRSNATKSGWDNLNGGPSTDEEYALTASDSNNGPARWDFAWQDSEHNLQFQTSQLSLFNPPEQLTADGSLASAPSIGYWGGNDTGSDPQYHIFYKGQDGYLHEWFFNSATGWHSYSYPQFGVLG